MIISHEAIEAKDLERCAAGTIDDNTASAVWCFDLSTDHKVGPAAHGGNPLERLVRAWATKGPTAQFGDLEIWAPIASIEIVTITRG